MKRLILFMLLFSSALFAQWQLRNNGLPSAYIGAIDALDQNYAVAASGSIYYTTDGGMSWTSIYTGLTHDITMVNATTILAVTDSTILKTTNAGANWQIVFTRPQQQGMFNYIKSFGNEIVAMTDCNNQLPGSRAGIYRSSDTGTTWTQVNQNYLQDCWSMDVWRKIDFGTAQRGIFFYSITGPAQRSVARSDDGGINWNTSYLGDNNYIHSLRMYDGNYGIGAGNDASGGAVFVTKDGGATWQKYVKSMNIQSAVAFVKNSPAEVFIGCSGQLWYSADSGKTWSRQSFPNTGIKDIVFTNQSNGWLCTSNGDVYWTDNKGTPVVSAKSEVKLPVEYVLYQNYPNPFNPSTRINFSLPARSSVSLKIFDMLGREINTIVNQELGAGYHSFAWNSDDYMGNKVSAGIYLYSMRADNFTFTRKMLLLK